MAYGANPYSSGYNAYKQVAVTTASQGKLLVMLYQGAVNNLENAINLIEEGTKIKASNIEAYGNYLQKTMDIISELQASLNMEQGGEIAKNLMSLYVYFNQQILHATASHDKEKLIMVKNMMSELHESWIQAANSTANGSVGMGSTQSFNFVG